MFSHMTLKEAKLSIPLMGFGGDTMSEGIRISKTFNSPDGIRVRWRWREHHGAFNSPDGIRALKVSTEALKLLLSIPLMGFRAERPS